MTNADQVRQAVMHAIDANRSSLDGASPLSRLDVTVFFNQRTGLPSDVEVRVTSKSEPKRQRELDRDAGRDERGVSGGDPRPFADLRERP